MARKQQYRIVGPFRAGGSKARAIERLQDALRRLGKKGWILPTDQMVLREFVPGTWHITGNGGATEFVARRPAR